MKLEFGLKVYTISRTRGDYSEEHIAIVATEINHTFRDHLTFVDKRLANLHDKDGPTEQTWRSYPVLKKL